MSVLDIVFKLFISLVLSENEITQVVIGNYFI